MDTQSPTAAQRVAKHRATFGIPEWQHEFRLKCEPYDLRHIAIFTVIVTYNSAP